MKVIPASSIAFAIAIGLALPAASQSAGTSAAPHSAMELPEACRAVSGKAMSDGKTMPPMMQSPEMQASMAKMTNAQKVYMEAMTKMHPSMMAGIMISDPDVAFSCAMISHHQGAIDMSRVVLKNGKDPQTKAMAEAIIRAQEKEIGEFKAWLSKKSASNAAPQKAGAVPAAAGIASAVPVSGEVIKVDQAAGKVTLKHGPIKNLDMDSMTMVFQVADPAMLAKVKAGDKVKFEADRVNGAITVTKIDKTL